MAHLASGPARAAAICETGMNLPEFIYTKVLAAKPLRRLANAVIRWIVPAQLRIGNATVVLNPNDPVISGALTFGVYEKPETRFFRAVCRPGITFLDIGANVGYYTALAMAAGASKVVALEPDPENFRYLEATIRANAPAQAIAVPKAAGTAPGKLTLYRSSSNRGDNRLYPNELSDQSCAVEVCTIDQLLVELNTLTVDLLKADVQGYEAQVLEGMQHTIARSSNLTGMMEFWPDGLMRAGTQPVDFLNRLEQLGLRLYELTSKGNLSALRDKRDLIARHPGRQYTNVVFFKGAATPPPSLLS